MIPYLHIEFQSTYNESDLLRFAGYDGDKIFRELIGIIETGQEIADEDMLNLIFLPLMRHTIEKGELAAKSVQLAQRIPDNTKRNAVIAAAFAFASKYLNETEINKLAEAIEMTDLVTLVIERAENRKTKEIAKNMLKRGTPASIIAEDTGLDNNAIRELQSELNNAELSTAV